MLPEKTYELVFGRQDGGESEHYIYPQKRAAMEHFRLFFSQDSEEMYTDIALYEIDWKTAEESRIAYMTFTEVLPDGSIIRKDWRNWPVGRKTVWETHEFDGDSVIEGVLTEKHEDHAIVEADGMRLWLDDDFAYMFR
jgi:hypothetical protein